VNSKEAVNAVLEHRRPDYIPLGTYAIDCDTVRTIIGHETYVRNKVAISKALWEGRRDEVAQSVKEDTVELFEKLPCIDLIVPHKEGLILPPKDYVPDRVKKIAENIYESETGYVYRISELTNDVTVIKNPEIDYTVEFFAGHNYMPPDRSIFEAYDHVVDHFKDTKYSLKNFVSRLW